MRGKNKINILTNGVKEYGFVHIVCGSAIFYVHWIATHETNKKTNALLDPTHHFDFL